MTHRPRPRLAGAIVVLVLVLVAAGLPGAGARATDPGRELQWGLDRIRADDSWAAGTGTGIVVAVVDTGVDLGHEDLAPRLVAGKDFVDGDDDPQDAEGHGTHVAGTVAAATNNGIGVTGVAPGARIMPVRSLGADGSGSGRDVFDGVKWAVDGGAKVVNLSLSTITDGTPAGAVFESSIRDAVRYAWDNGAIAVVAAGNDFVLSSSFGDENALVVSATDRNDRKPGYSNGVGSAKWGIAAPGGAGNNTPEDGILSTLWTGEAANQYGFLSGTSMAAPHVSGAMAILLGLGLTREQAVNRLLSTAVDLGPAGRDSDFGHGRLDLVAATHGLSQGPTTAAPTTTATTTTPTPPTSAAPATAPTTAPSATTTSTTAAPTTTTAAPAPASNGSSETTEAADTDPGSTTTSTAPDTTTTADEADIVDLASPDGVPTSSDSDIPGWAIVLAGLALAGAATGTYAASRRS